MSAEDKDNKSILHTICCLLFLMLGTTILQGQQKRFPENAIAPVSELYKKSLYLPVTARPEKTPLAVMWETLGKYTGMEKPEVGLSVADMDSLARLDSVRAHTQLEAPAFSMARDSVVEDFRNGRTLLYYYGDVKVTYDNMEITSEYMEYNADTKTVFATGIIDSTGVMQGKPVMKEGNNNYEMESVYYNFTSRKARINNMVTQDEQGFLHGTTLKKMPDNSINIKGGKYTTCDAEHPHFYLHMTNAKITSDEDGNVGQTIFGPSYVVIEDVPTPIVVPFGFVPKRPERSGGLLIPSYGEEVARGFFLRDLGYYFVFGDYLDFSVTGDIYSLGSWSIKGTARYKNRYKYNGNLNVNYSKNVTGERGSADYQESGDFSIRWSHTQDPKKRPGTSFSASVNFSSPTNNRFNSRSVDEALQSQTSSSISYAKTFAGTPFNLSINLLHSQNNRDSSYALTLPNLTFTMSRINPFQRKERIGKKRFYEDISISYNTAFQNKLTFKASQFGKPEFWDDYKTGMQHNFAIGLPSFTLLKYLNFTPTVSYGMNWHFMSETRTFDPARQKVVSEMSKPFSEFGITQSYSGGISMSTRIYGMFNFKPTGKLRAIRHMMTPSLSFGYHPELGTRANGFVTLDYTDSLGREHSVEYNKYSRSVYGPPSKGRTAAISFSLGNNLEAKVFNKKDTTENGELKKVKLIDNLSLSGSYNFLADSMRLSNINVTLSTSIFEKLGINANAMFDPYAVNEHGERINTFNVVKTGNLARLTNASFSTSYSFNGGGDKSKNDAYQLIYEDPLTGEYIPGGWVYYMEPEIPWSVNLNYSFSYNKSYTYANEQLNVNHNFTQTLGFSAQVKLTKDFSINIRSGLDLMKFRLTTTQLSATYDLHCFQISFSWVPNGQWESWSFRIAAKASALADLLQYTKNSSYWDN
ncbi:MAG TPA: putative LPS assembly protein LptD [Bacteroidales bacterium]|nr:LPS-assembly protein LptD [Bacteroidales bacterium]OQC56039.1 MAG: LPS-assembly protein LptD [Bacteroidetes bacterium ADurb.Bin013]MBP8998676.1 LPS-assembly protein LptD [Bacteroidales bacterium]MBV6456512.1 LPS-assembly protein LptD [Bacteroidales bacterium]MCZ2316919.1 LPS-assembly protein LptD [Bacteroidales bacterium]